MRLSLNEGVFPQFFSFFSFARQREVGNEKQISLNEFNFAELENELNKDEKYFLFYLHSLELRTDNLNMEIEEIAFFSSILILFVYIKHRHRQH